MTIAKASEAMERWDDVNLRRSQHQTGFDESLCNRSNRTERQR